MSGTHLLIIVGKLSKDPEMSYTPQGKAITKFSICTSRTYKGKDGEKREEKEWWNFVAWENQAENCQTYLSKGSEVYIEAAMKATEYGSPRIWTANDGTPRSSYEATIKKIQFLSSNKASEENQSTLYDEPEVHY